MPLRFSIWEESFELLRTLVLIARDRWQTASLQEMMSYARFIAGAFRWIAAKSVTRKTGPRVFGLSPQKLSMVL
jgi:hypothetical protein